MNINPIQQPSIQNLDSAKSGTKPGSAAGNIGSTFAQALESLSQSQAESDQLIEMLAAGEDVDVHRVMIASEQTDIQFRIAVGIRDKLVDAYREIMRMAV